jgi:hypothetical protein
MSLATLFAVLAGLFLLLQWSYFFATGQMADLRTEPAKAALHLLAEFVTAVALIVGGWAVFADQAWGMQLYLVAMGMLLYAVINGSGEYVEIRAWTMAGVFLVLFLSALLVLRLAL